jgi:1-acyl-sn-glycerol-3-phosphate acyltransferase
VSTIRFLARAAHIILALLACVPLHYLSLLLLRRSRWPRRFLGWAAYASGMRVRVEGTPLERDVLFLANHLSWLDILVLAGASGTAFVAKDDVAAWPVVGWLARLNDTVFIARTSRSEVKGQADALRAALASGQPVALFPEGTTEGGPEILPFRASLLASDRRGALFRPSGRSPIKSFGCQMNVYDGERMAELLEAQGMAAPPKARTPTSSSSTPATSARKRRRRPIRTSAGCARGRLEAADRARRLRRPGRRRRDPAPRAAIDIVVGPQAYHRCPSWSPRRARGGGRSTPTCRRSKFDALPARRAPGPFRLPDRPGGLRQILHLLRRALHARRRGLAAVGRRSPRPGRWSTPARARSFCSART